MFLNNNTENAIESREKCSWRAENLKGYTFLGYEPFRIRANVDHGDCGAALESGDQLKQERCCRFALGWDRVATIRITEEHAVSCDASEIEAAIGATAAQRLPSDGGSPSELV